jgi:polysaccharide export outer membrane protein
MDKDINYNADITQAKYNGNKLMVGDNLDIKVTGYDEIAIKPFNLNTISQINGNGGHKLFGRPKLYHRQRRRN